MFPRKELPVGLAFQHWAILRYVSKSEKCTAARDLLTPETAILVKKGTYGSRDLPALVDFIRSQGTVIESIEFAGVSTTCRVLHNAVIAYNFFPELPLIFDERTTASYTDERTAEQLDELESWGFIVKRS